MLYFKVRLSLYILKRHIGPFIFSMVTITFIFLLQFLMQSMDQIVGKGLGLGVIVQLIVYNLAWIIVLAVPMSVLVAVLMAFGGLSSYNEVTAIKGSGISLIRMMLPVLVASIGVFYLLVLFDNDVLPDANHRAKTIMIDIRRKKPTFTIEPGQFSQEIEGHAILVRKTVPNSTELYGVTIFDFSNPQKFTTITAERGKVGFSPDMKHIVMLLYDGEVDEYDNSQPSVYQRMRFQHQQIVLSAEGFSFEESSQSAFSRGDRELSADSMRSIVKGLRKTTGIFQTELNGYMNGNVKNLILPSPNRFLISAAGDSARIFEQAGANISSALGIAKGILASINTTEREIYAYRVEIQKKYSIPFAAIVFVFLGAPLGMMTRRGNFGVSAGLSLFFFLIYWAFLIAGEKLADRELLSPFMAMWLANIVLGGLGLILTYKTSKEAVIINWDNLMRFLPKKWVSEETLDEISRRER
ncbi:MAG: LptF/LptG family permease [Bacteroidetes bacterium]|nr:LptF/LptG family permease [Bacteroidota bacterium]